MGTSNKFGGPSPASALIPTFLDDPFSGTPTGDIGKPEKAKPEDEKLKVDAPAEQDAKPLTPLPAHAAANRFRSSRGSFNTAATSRNTGALRSSLSSYVSKGMGGSRGASRNMGSSVSSAGRAIGFVQDAVRSGVDAALKNLGVGNLVGQPGEQALAALTDVLCPPGGPIDQGIAREAWNEAVLELTDAGIAEITDVTPEQWHALAADFISKTIETKVINDVGAKGISLPQDVSAINQLQNDLHQLIRGAVDDSIGDRLTAGAAIPQNELQSVAMDIYERSFAYLEALE